MASRGNIWRLLSNRSPRQKRRCAFRKRQGWQAETLAVKSWLLSAIGYQRLQDTYDPESFRLATCKQALEFDVSDNRRAAQMELVFNCKPQR